MWGKETNIKGPPGPQGIQGIPGAASTVPGPAGPTGPAGSTGPTGPTGANGAPGPQGVKGDTGAQGPPGTAGATGGTGPAGTPGEGWFTGSGNPGAVSGAVNNDWYLNSANGDYWELVSGTWTLRGNLKGPQGPTGATGPAGPTGSGSGDVNGPASGIDNDIALFSGTSGKTIKDSGVQLSALQPKDATLTALAGLAATNGLIEQTGVDVFGIRGIGVSPTTSIPTTALADARYAAIVHIHAESDITNLVSDLAAKAPLASPVFTGNPTAPTVTAGDNDTSIATTAFVTSAVATGVASVPAAPAPATVAPLMDGVAAVGVATKYAREDHKHPTDTSREPTITGGTTAQYWRGDKSFQPLNAVAVGITAAALTKTDDANVTLTLGGTPATALLQASSITAGWTGTLSTTRGGLGANNSAANGLPLFASGVVTMTAASTVVGASAVRYDAAQSLTAAQMSQARANINLTKKNYIINGAMMVSQENGTTAGTVTGYFPADQFFINLNAMTGVYSVQQIVSPTPGGSPNRIRVTVTTADASVGTSDIVWIAQRLEGNRFADLRFGSASAKTVTLQFGIKAPAGTYGIALRNGTANNRCYVAECVVTAGEANTDVVKSVTFPGDVTGSWATDNANACEISWTLMGGTIVQGAPNVWTAAGVITSSNQFNFMASTSNVFELFDVSLTEGTVAPPFQVPDYASELLLCQRYYFKQVLGIFGYNAAGAFAEMWPNYPVTMRVAPTLSATGGTFNNTNGAIFPDNANTYRCRNYFQATATGAFTVDNYTLTGSARL